MNQEEIKKSAQALIDEMFDTETEIPTITEEETIEKAKQTADEAIAEAPKSQDDAKRGAGRPQEITDVPKKDKDGKRAGKYDDDITENDGKEDQPAETKDQIKVKDQVTGGGKDKASPAPDMAPFKKSISDEDFEEYTALKKAKEDAIRVEELKKAQADEGETLKKAMSEVIEPLKKAFDELKAKNEEQADLIKAISNRPVSTKSITSVEQLEKSQDPQSAGPETFSKAEVADAIDDLVKSKDIGDNYVIEYELSGNIANQAVKQMIEKKLQKK